MRHPVSLSISVVLSLASIAAIGSEAQQQHPASRPPLAPCGTTHGAVEVLCGVHAPEDLEPTPDGKYLIVAQLEHADPSGVGRGLALFNLASKAAVPMPITVAPRADWGSPSCPGPMGDKLVAHGISLARRTGGTLELYVINHNFRESMEMFELTHARGGAWALLWHGCVVSPREFNDVAAFPDGSFVASHPTALMGEDKDRALLYSGKPIGYVVHWTRSNGEQEMPGTRVGYPNGVIVTPNGRFMYLDAWTAREVHKYDLHRNEDTHSQNTPNRNTRNQNAQTRDISVIKLNFMPDNLSWVDPHLNPGTHGHPMLSAGIVAFEGYCPTGGKSFCIQQFRVAEIDPVTMRSKILYQSTLGDEPLLSGASVAVKVRSALYIGSYEGDRLLKIKLKK